MLASLFGGGPDNPLDQNLSLAFIHMAGDSPYLSIFMKALTWAGDAQRLLPLTALVVVILLWRRRWRVALLLGAASLVERLSVDLLKSVTERPRPQSPYEAWMPPSYAWPSGHSANSLTTMLLIALLAVPAAWRPSAAALALLFAAAVGLSRVMLGVHWPSDVVGGWAFGLLAVWMTLKVGAASGAIEPQHQIIGRHRPALDETESA